VRIGHGEATVKKLNGTLLFSVLMVGVGGLLTLSAWSITTSPFDPVGARVFPLSIATALLLLCLVQFALRIREARRPAASEPAEATPPDYRAIARVVIVLAVFAACVLLMQFKLINALAAMAITVVAGALALAPTLAGKALPRELAWAALLAAILVAAAYLLFVQTFGIRL
jgi:hypothetical protein